jgi:hypothetical protein
MSIFKLKDYTDDYYESNFKSSIVDSYAYDCINCTLVVKFTCGSRYLYSGVPQSVADRFMITPSKGSFINMQLKGYPYLKFDEK